MIIVRPAKADEYDVLGAIMVAAYRALVGFPGPEAMPSYYAMLAKIGAYADRPGLTLLAASLDGVVQGGVLYVDDLDHYGADRVFEGQRGAAFRLLAVAPQAGGQGIGRALMDACITRAIRQGQPQVLIHSTEAMVQARRLYERRGFTRAPEFDFVQAGILNVLGYRLSLRVQAPIATQGSDQG